LWGALFRNKSNDYYDRGAWDFLVNEGPGYTPPEVNVTFPSNGTYYDLNYRIHIGGESHTKALDVVQHEYGHFIMHMIYGLYWPITHCPNPHSIDEFSHPNCAWTEGWANFFPLAVQNEPNFELGNGDDENLETKTWGTPNWDDGDGVEGRVAGLFLMSMTIGTMAMILSLMASSTSGMSYFIRLMITLSSSTLHGMQEGMMCQKPMQRYTRTLSITTMNQMSFSLHPTAEAGTAV